MEQTIWNRRLCPPLLFQSGGGEKILVFYTISKELARAGKNHNHYSGRHQSLYKVGLLEIIAWLIDVLWILKAYWQHHATWPWYCQDRYLSSPCPPALLMICSLRWLVAHRQACPLNAGLAGALEGTDQRPAPLAHGQSKCPAGQCPVPPSAPAL